MQIVDAQIHLWKANTPDRPWFSPRAQLPEELAPPTHWRSEAL